MSSFHVICDDINIPLSEEKTEGPTTNLTYLGFELDTVAMKIRIPLDKISKARHCLQETIASKKVRLNAFQSLVGLLNFFTRAIPSGRAFNSELYFAMSQAKKPHHFIRITTSIRHNLKTWLFFLEKYNGVSVFCNLD